MERCTKITLTGFSVRSMSLIDLIKYDCQLIPKNAFLLCLATGFPSLYSKEHRTQQNAIRSETPSYIVSEVFGLIAALKMCFETIT